MAPTDQRTSMVGGRSRGVYGDNLHDDLDFNPLQIRGLQRSSATVDPDLNVDPARKAEYLAILKSISNKDTKPGVFPHRREWSQWSRHPGTWSQWYKTFLSVIYKFW